RLVPRRPSTPDSSFITRIAAGDAPRGRKPIPMAATDVTGGREPGPVEPGASSVPSYIANFHFRGTDGTEVAALYRCDRRPPVFPVLILAGVLLAVNAFWLFVFVIGRMFGAW